MKHLHLTFLLLVVLLTSVAPTVARASSRADAWASVAASAAAPVAAPAPSALSGPILTLRGVVRDRETRQPLPYATVSRAGGEVGTVCNADGEFILKVDPAQVPPPASANPATGQAPALEGSRKQASPTTAGDGSGVLIEVSHLGYRTARFPLSEEPQSRPLTVWLSPVSTPLAEIIALSGDARAIVDEALRRIDQNYPDQPRTLTAFYRETTRKRRRYIQIAEAVVQVTKSAYTLTPDISTDRVRIHRGRKLLSQRPSDTVAVKLQGGPTLPVYMDLVKSPDQLLSPDLLDCFNYRLQSIVQVDERPVYVVSFAPRTLLDFPLYSGHYYIDVETLTLTRAEYAMDLTDRPKAIRAILRRKPAGLRFRPVEVSFVVDYRRTTEGRSRLHYVRSLIQFRCDWRRRLFATEYSVVAEAVVTDSRPGSARDIPAREQFSRTQIFADDATLFADPDFWGDYNIIAPEESLEHAVDRLTKKQKATNNEQ